MSIVTKGGKLNFETMRKYLRNFSYYGIISGTCAAAGSIFGKLSGSTDVFSSDNVTQTVIKVVFIALMIISNAAVWTFFVKALQQSNSSLVTTITSTAANYICSGIAGLILFGEKTSLLWWCGTVSIIAGLVLILKDSKQNPKEKIP